MQKTGGLILTIYMSHDVFLHKELPFRGHDDCNCVELFRALNYLIAINSSTH